MPFSASDVKLQRQVTILRAYQQAGFRLLALTVADPNLAGVPPQPLTVAMATDSSCWLSDGVAWFPFMAGGLTVAGGDLSGTYPNPTVDGLQARPVAATAPAVGEVLTWSGAAWSPAAVAVTAPLGTIRLQTSAVQTIASGTDQFTPSTSYHRFVCTGNQTLTSTPTITWPGAVAGQVVILHNVGALGAGHVTLNRGVATALSLSNANQRVDEGGTMMLVYDGAIWTEVTHTQATST